MAASTASGNLFYCDPKTGVWAQGNGGGSSGLTIGTTAITGGTANRLLLSGTTLGESTCTSSGGALNCPNGFTGGTSGPALTPGTGGAFGLAEGTAPSVGPASAVDVIYSDSTQHGLLANFNNAGYLPLVQGPASNTTGHFATWSGTNGGKLVDGGAVPASFATLGANTFTGQQINSLNGALSTPPMLVSGTWVTSGGTSTTTKPQVLIECNSGTTTSTGWNTAGTGLGVNACTGFAGNLIDLRLNGVDVFWVSNGGSVTTTNNITTTGSYYFNGGGSMRGPSNGVFEFVNSVGTGFTRMDFGSDASVSWPALTVTSQTNPILSVVNSNSGATAQLQVAGTLATGSGDVNLCWTTTGIFTQGSVCGTSLLKDKSSIVDLDHGLDWVMAMHPVSYTRIATGKAEYGFIAEEVAGVDALLGTYNAQTGNLANVSDRAVIATLVKAVQDLEKQIQELKHQ
jgi:hypothetical protein